MITQEKVKELFDYYPDSGVLIRKDTGKEVGYETEHGYRRTTIKGRHVYVHRLVWLYVYGYLPENDVDHINRDKLDNRIENLREASRLCNVQNRKVNSNNTSGKIGVFLSRQGRWRARITFQGKRYNLGTFDCIEEAAAHRRAAEECLGWCSHN